MKLIVGDLSKDINSLWKNFVEIKKDFVYWFVWKKHGKNIIGYKAKIEWTGKY